LKKLTTEIKNRALDGFQGGEPNEHEMQRIEPPRRQGRQVEKERLREIKQRKSGIYLSSYTLSLLASLASWRFNSSMELIDSMDHPGIHQEPSFFLCDLCG
jgi:hypothetical protein